MDYITLKRAFHDPKIDEEALYEERFHSDEAVHIGIEANGYYLFFLMTPEIYRSIIRIAKADKEILRLSSKLPGKAIEQFTLDNLINEIVLTNEIEGVNSTRREIGDVLKSLESADKRHRFQGLVNKYFLLNSSEWSEISSPEDIRKLYDELVLDEVAAQNKDHIPDGELFRKDSVSVYDTSGKEIHRGVLPEEKIIEYLSKSLSFLNREEELEMLVRIAAFHFLFGYIHPFYDGNGRMGRFISSQYISKVCEPIVGYGLSYTIKQRLTEYYSAFKESESVLSRGDITPFVIAFSDMIAESSERISNILRFKLDKFLHYGKLIHERLESSQVSIKDAELVCSVLLQAALFSEDGISLKELCEVCSISRNTLYLRLKDLERVVNIKRIRVGRETHLALDLDAFDL